MSYSGDVVYYETCPDSIDDDADEIDARPSAEICPCGEWKHEDHDWCDACSDERPACPACGASMVCHARCGNCGRHAE